MSQDRVREAQMRRGDLARKRAADADEIQRAAPRDTVDRLLSDFSDNGPVVSYYQFPGGVEVRDISAYLSSFGGQAVQYIARATRLDGNNKGEPIRDLEKARDLLGWEITRLRVENNV